MSNAFSNNLRRLRQVKNLTQEQVADKLGVSAQSVSRWECGNTYPDVMLLPEIARLYSVTVDDLYREKTAVYPNYAIRLLSVYENSRAPSDFLGALEEFDRLFATGEYTNNDMRSYGILHQFMMNDCMDKAEKVFDNIIGGKYPGDEETVWWTKHQRLGFLAKIGRAEESVKQQLEIIKAGSCHHRDWVLLIAALLMAGDVDNAKEWSEKALEQFPEEPMIWGSCGDVYEALKQYDQALKCWEKALELDPGLYDCRYSIGFCNEKLGQYQKAYEVWIDIVQRLEREGYEMELEFPAELARKCKEKLDQ